MHNIPFSNGNIVISCDKDGVCMTRPSDGLKVQTFFSPFEFGACAMALMTDEYRQEGRLRNTACRAVTREKASASAICELYPLSPRIPPAENGKEEKQKQFSEKTAPLKAMMSVRVFDSRTPDMASFRSGFTDFDLVALLRLVACSTPSGCMVIGLSLSVMIEEDQGLSLRCGGSEWRKVTEQERRRLVTKLRQWLSGDRSRYVTFNAEGLHFNRRPRLIVNNVSTHPLSFTEVAQLYLLLATCKGHDPGVPALMPVSSSPQKVTRK